MYTLGKLIDSVGECHDLRYVTVYQDGLSETFIKREIDGIDIDMLFREVDRYEIDILKVGCYAHLKVWMK